MKVAAASAAVVSDLGGKGNRKQGSAVFRDHQIENSPSEKVGKGWENVFSLLRHNTFPMGLTEHQ